jgi:quinol-cytochrome oxidoreductase complex cytochrome b subunit
LVHYLFLYLLFINRVEILCYEISIRSLLKSILCNTIQLWFETRFWSKYAGWIIISEIFFYPTPLNLGYFYCIGSVLGLTLFIQLLSGVLVASYYIPFVSIAFTSVDYVIRELAITGFCINFIHVLGSSLFLSLTFIHILRAICYSSFQTPKHKVLISG